MSFLSKKINHIAIIMDGNGRWARKNLVNKKNGHQAGIDTAIKICSILDDLILKKPQGVKLFRDLICYVDDRPGHDRRYAIDSSKIQSTLNWRPKESFDTGLKKTVKWYLDNPQWWQAIFKKNYALERLGKN